MPELIDVEPGTPEWLAARRLGVTATDIVTILGLSSRDSVYSLFWRKLGQVPETGDSDRFRLGRQLEPYIRERWLEEHPDSGMRDGGLFRSSARSWQMATPDQLTGPAGTAADPVAVLECKSWADVGRHAWGGGYERYTGRIDDDGTHLDPEPVQPPAGNQIPPTVRAQVLWQMDVMDVAVGHVGVVFLPSGKFRSYVLQHTGPHAESGSAKFSTECDACTDLSLMRLAGEEFMGRLRLELPPPDPDSSAATLAAVRARFARQPAKQAEIDPDLWTRYDAHCRMADGHKQVKRELEILLREQAGEAAEYTVGGELVARRVVSDAPVKAHTRHQDYIGRVK